MTARSPFAKPVHVPAGSAGLITICTTASTASIQFFKPPGRKQNEQRKVPGTTQPRQRQQHDSARFPSSRFRSTVPLRHRPMHILLALATRPFVDVLRAYADPSRPVSYAPICSTGPTPNASCTPVAVPRIGGIPIVLSYVAALGLLFAFHPGGGRLYIQHQQLLHALLPAACAIFFVGSAR